ncbi:MAG TPA: Hsp70 family protein [Polyangiaceae bacterium]|nr:Hsp70 family protein [Polyangiaceae bacterium]
MVSFTDPSGDAIECFPSVVAERGGELRFGFDAERLVASPEWTIVRSFKRLLNDPSPDAVLSIGSSIVPATQLLAAFFSALRRALLEGSNIGPLLEPGEKIEAFIAAPANAHSTQRFLCLDAFRRAGFDVLGLLNEPSAAGFEYTHRYRNTLTSKKDRVVVYDIGGGTFDVSLLRMTGALHEVVATSGMNRLGGDDFDGELMALALAKVGVAREALAPRAERLLLEQCRNAKEQLNPSSRKLTLELATSLGKLAPKPEITIEVGEFYARLAPLIERTIRSMLSVICQDDTLDDGARELPSEIAGIYVVGGASSLPAVGRALREAFGKRVHRSPYPSASAAIGLAIAADKDAGMQLSDRFSRVFGVFREARSGSEVTFDPIFQRDVILPNGGDELAVVERTYRAAHNVGHFRYVECAEVDPSGQPRGDMASFADIYFPFDPGLQNRNAELGSVSVERLHDGGPLIRETYAVNAHGIVEVRITNLDDRYELAYRLSPSASA